MKTQSKVVSGTNRKGENMKTSMLALIFLSAVGASSAFAQGMSNMDHTTGPGKVIDGSITPELIQDKDAYRLFFLATSSVGSNKSEDEKKVYIRLVFRSLTTDETYLLTINSVLETFRSQYEYAVLLFNRDAEATAKSGKVPDYEALELKLEAITESTRRMLQISLPEGLFHKLQDHVRGEKTRMKVAQ